MIRPPQPDDAEAVAKLVIASDIAEIGEPDYTLEDLRDEWAARDFDLATDAVVVEAEGRIVGYAAFRGTETLLIVDPERLGEGFGSALRAWAEERAREKGLATIRQEAGDRNAAAREHLTAAGYERERSYWRMELELDGSETPPQPPKGFAIRAYDEAADGHALYLVSSAAFSRNADYRPETESRRLRARPRPRREGRVRRPAGRPSRLRRQGARQRAVADGIRGRRAGRLPLRPARRRVRQPERDPALRPRRHDAALASRFIRARPLG